MNSHWIWSFGLKAEYQASINFKSSGRKVKNVSQFQTTIPPPNPTPSTHTCFPPSYYPEGCYKKSELTLGLLLSNQFSSYPRLLWNKEVLPPAGCSQSSPLALASVKESRETGKQGKRNNLDISTSGYISRTASWQEMPAEVQSSTAWPQPLGSHKNPTALYKCSKSTCCAY